MNMDRLGLRGVIALAVGESPDDGVIPFAEWAALIRHTIDQSGIAIIGGGGSARERAGALSDQRSERGHARGRSGGVMNMDRLGLRGVIALAVGESPDDGVIPFAEWAALIRHTIDQSGIAIIGGGGRARERAGALSDQRSEGRHARGRSGGVMNMDRLGLRGVIALGVGESPDDGVIPFAEWAALIRHTIDQSGIAIIGGGGSARERAGALSDQRSERGHARGRSGGVMN